jgi:hypothetical protein
MTVGTSMTACVMEFPPTHHWVFFSNIEFTYLFLFLIFYYAISLCPLCIVYVSISMVTAAYMCRSSILVDNKSLERRHMSAAVTIRLYGYRHVHVKQ